MLCKFSCFLSYADCFRKSSFRNTIKVSKSLDPDQARHFVGPDLGPNFLKYYQQTTLVDKGLQQAWFWKGELSVCTIAGLRKTTGDV